jgi:predicted site-specific integrase-resolvase
VNYPPPFMDKQTLAEHLCVSPRTVDAWVKQGVLPPPIPMGGSLRWRWKDVEKRLAEQERQPEDKALSIREATRAAASETH